MSCGIYRILNRVSGRCYIGSAQDIKNRFSQHLAGLRKGNHHSPALQRAWNKYGFDVFLFSIIEICSKKRLQAREQFWMKTFNALSPNGYNVCPKAGSCRGYKHRAETIVKFRNAALLIAKRPGESKRRSVRAKLQHAKGNLGLATMKISKKEWARRISNGHKRRPLSSFRKGFKWPLKSRQAFSRKIKKAISAGTWHFGRKK